MDAVVLINPGHLLTTLHSSEGVVAQSLVTVLTFGARNKAQDLEDAKHTMLIFECSKMLLLSMLVL